MHTVRREYAVATRIVMPLYTYADGKDFYTTTPVHASGDITISIDEGAFSTLAAGFTHIGGGWIYIDLSAANVTGKRIIIKVVDQGSKAWIDDGVIIETFGHANAMYPDNNNAIADAVLSRDVDQVEATMAKHSLGTVVLKEVSRVVWDDTANSWIIYQTDGTTVKLTRAGTQSASPIQPITEMGVGT